jgi:site-specific recombinase XerD
MVKEIDDFLNTIKRKSVCTYNSYELAIRKMVEYLHIESLGDLKEITRIDVRNYQDFLQQSGISNSSVNAYIRPLKSLFNWLIDYEHVEKSPFDKIKGLKEVNKEVAFLSDDEVRSLISACKTMQDKLMISMFVSTGARRAGLINLKVSDIKDGHITLHEKGEKFRSVLLQPEVNNLLEEYLEYRKTRGIQSEYLFVSKANTKFSGPGVYEKIKSICKRAGIPEDRIELIHVHSLRHTFCANVLEATNGNMKIAQTLMGHANESTTSKIYAHVRNTVLDQAILSMKPVL